MADLEFGAEARALIPHVIDKFRPLNTFGETWKVFHEGCEGQLSTRFVAFDHKRFEVSTGGVEGGGEAGASRADDDDVANVVSHRNRNRFLAAKKDATALGGRWARYFLRVKARANQRAAQRILTSKGGLANGNATQTITGGTGR